MKNKHDGGSVMLETVLIMPILFIMIMAVLQLAQIWMARQVVKYAAYCAARATLTSNQYTAHAHAKEAARQVCAWIAFSDQAEDFVTDSVNGGICWWEKEQFGVEEAWRYVTSIVMNNNSIGDKVLNKEMEIPGWGRIPNSGSVDRRLRVHAGLVEPYNYLSSWETKATVEFDFPLLMPVAGKMLSYLAKEEPEALQKKLKSGEVGFAVGTGWTGQQVILDSEKSIPEHAYPYITITETCILPKPYSTAIYPCTSSDLDMGLKGIMP